jgi:hypothetical protein
MYQHIFDCGGPLARRHTNPARACEVSVFETTLSWLACVLYAYCPVGVASGGWLGGLSFCVLCRQGDLLSIPADSAVLAMFRSGHSPDLLLDGHPDSPATANSCTDPTRAWCHSSMIPPTSALFCMRSSLPAHRPSSAPLPYLWPRAPSCFLILF